MTINETKSASGLGQINQSINLKINVILPPDERSDKNVNDLEFTDDPIPKGKSDSSKVFLENGWNSKQMITEGEAAIPARLR